MQETFDVVVIGGGPGGYVAAIRAAQLGLKTVLVEKAQLGGVCLNWGCIPTKALLRSADVLRLVRNSGQFGIKTSAVEPDLPAMVARSRKVAAQLNQGVTHLMKKNGVVVERGHARLAGIGAVSVQCENGETHALKARHVILATGARARQLPQFPVGDKTVWSYREALDPPFQPQQMVIVGAGAIGIEFACFYNAIGVQVTVVEAASRVLPAEDEEISAQVAKSLRQDGIELRLSGNIQQARRTDTGWQLTLGAGDGGAASSAVDADVVLVAAGIVGNVEDLGLETTRVRVEKTHIVTDAFCQTHESGVHAIGDVAGPPWLAHKASHEGVICAEHIAGLATHRIDPLRVPACTYSHPQVASVGMTEAQARALGKSVRVGKFPFSANGKAIAMGETEGFAKVVFDADSGELLGAHMVGHEVTEMIQGFGIAQSLEATEADLMSAIIAHPTMSESMHEAVLAAYGRTLHL